MRVDCSVVLKRFVQVELRYSRSEVTLADQAKG